MPRIRIAVIGDIHYVAAEATPSAPGRVGKYGDIFLLRAVRRLKRFVKPDVTLVVGDVVDSGGREELARIKATLDLLDMPWLIVPGNHDGDTGAFDVIFGSRPQMVDVKGFRFVALRDPEQPGYNALRTEEGFALMRQARANHAGPIVAVQHVPLFPPGRLPSPYNYINAGEVIAAMRQERIGWAISGHFHAGCELLRDAGTRFLVAPALCESPYQFLQIDIDGEDAAVTRHVLRNDPALKLNDQHTHTHFAYCNENLDCAKSVELAQLLGIDKLAFTEHSEHLYFRESDWGIVATSDDIFATAKDRLRLRFPEYLDEIRPHLSERVLPGAEIDVDVGGHGVIRPEHASRLALRIGAMHQFPKGTKPEDYRRVFLRLLEDSLRKNRFHILAHPLRLFVRSKVPVPADVFGPVAKLLKQHGVAAEINFHTNEPPAEFFACCLEEGVKLSLGSDSHNLCEIGDFYPHRQVLEKIGALSKLDTIFFQPP
jgi:histidinol phosphatase-like PHP family hydrolase